MRTKLTKVHTVKSQMIVQFDKFNGHASVVISRGYSLVKQWWADLTSMLIFILSYQHQNALINCQFCQKNFSRCWCSM